jgi:hypothetical protein
MFVPEKPKRIPYASYQVRGIMFFIVLLTLFFWAIYIWSLTDGAEPYVPVTAILSTIGLVAGFNRLRRVKAQEAEDERTKGATSS